MAKLAEEFKERYPKFSGLAMAEEADRLTIGDNNESSLEILENDGEWEVHCRQGHGHVGSFQEALQLASMLLRGEARFTEEYRGDVHSAGWIEVLKEGEFVLNHLAIYSSPFDPDEWELWEGETWRQIRTVRRVTPNSKIETESWETEADKATGEQFNWLSDGLGDPEPGMKWVTRGSNFVLQCPLGWRRNPGQSDSDIDLYLPEGKQAIFRAYAWFRDSPNPNDEAVGNAVWPASIEFSTEPENNSWHTSKWTLFFSTGQEDMMGNIELFTRPNEFARREELIRMIDRAMRRCVFVAPSGDSWNCKDVVPSNPVRQD